jgi:hypothetical protein
VYDIDICNVRSNTELRKLLIRMKNRSILLVEDVDCALATAPRRGITGAPMRAARLARIARSVPVTRYLQA